jgi:hypothetical protein
VAGEVALPGLNRRRSLVIRKLTDDTLVVFLPDSHIGGSEGRDIFESPDDLAALFASLHDPRRTGGLVLAGDSFDFLRVGEVPVGQSRASLTIARPEYAELFAALRRFASGPNRTVVYLPGNPRRRAVVEPGDPCRARARRSRPRVRPVLAASFESDASRALLMEEREEAGSLRPPR